MRRVYSPRLYRHDPYAYLRDVLERPPTLPASHIDDFAAPHLAVGPSAELKSPRRQDGITARLLQVIFMPQTQNSGQARRTQSVPSQSRLRGQGPSQLMQ